MCFVCWGEGDREETKPIFSFVMVSLRSLTIIARWNIPGSSSNIYIYGWQNKFLQLFHILWYICTWVLFTICFLARVKCWEIQILDYPIGCNFQVINVLTILPILDAADQLVIICLDQWPSWRSSTASSAAISSVFSISSTSIISISSTSSNQKLKKSLL